MLRLSSALLIVALCCALTLAVIYYNTAPRIEEQKKMLEAELAAVQADIKAVDVELSSNK
jgi:cell division protein FtsL